MTDSNKVTNVVISGLGGQGVLKASDILGDVVFAADYDVKKSEVHGMSQRGGSVSTDVRFGEKVLSPMVPIGEADYLVVLDSTQVEPNRHKLREGGTLICPKTILGEDKDIPDLRTDKETPLSRRNFNVAMIGALSKHLPHIPEEDWLKAVFKNLPKKLHELNQQVFKIGRDAA